MKPVPGTAETIRRNSIGALAAVFLAVGLYLWFFPGQTAGARQMESLAWRLGAVLGMWWLAYPVIRRLPAWLWVALPAVAVLAVVRFKWLLLLLPLLILLAVLKPRPKKRR